MFLKSLDRKKSFALQLLITHIRMSRMGPKSVFIDKLYAFTSSENVCQGKTSSRAFLLILIRFGVVLLVYSFLKGHSSIVSLFSVPEVRITGDSEMHVEAGSSVALKCLVSKGLHRPKYVHWYRDKVRLVNSLRDGVTIVDNVDDLPAADNDGGGADDGGGVCDAKPAVQAAPRLARPRAYVVDVCDAPRPAELSGSLAEFTH